MRAAGSPPLKYITHVPLDKKLTKHFIDNMSIEREMSFKTCSLEKERKQRKEAIQHNHLPTKYLKL